MSVNRIQRFLVAVITAIVMCVSQIPVNAKGFSICYDGETHLYTGEVYKLLVNGKEISSPMEPIIFNDHALVPVREVFEACGAKVTYIGETQCVKVHYNGRFITVYINKNYAYVNGKEVKIPDGVVPKLINKPNDETKTMVPVRFIAENAGMHVNFDGNKGTIAIDEKAVSTPKPTATPVPTPAPTAKPTVSPTAKPSEGVTVKKISAKLLSDTKAEITVTCDKSPKDIVSDFKLSSPERVVVDFKGAYYKNVTETIKLNSKVITSVRVGVDSERTRIVTDVTGLKNYSVDISGKTATITVTVSSSKAPTATATPTSKPNYSQAGSSAANSKYNTGIVQASSADAKKIIMIDAGHGGTDPGAIGNLKGKTVNEKDLTLTLAYKVKAILESNGYKTAMTRTGDTLPSLSERPEMANNKNCALFVSIHINSATATEAYGTEVYYSEENNSDEYGVTSQELATKVLDGMLKYMKSYDRGVRMANWAVIRRSDMPAVLVEVGFISNEKELANMCNDDYQNKTAMGIAEGIINTIHYVNVPK